jgi:anti-sigma regulatory factor (Ser/Thr protein kinase)
MAEWSKKIRRTGGAEGGWREDFPLNRDMPEELIIDCEALEPPVYSLFWLRLRTFLDWHHAQGRSLSVVPPAEHQARMSFDQMQVVDTSYIELRENEKPNSLAGIAILPLTPIADHTTVEVVAATTREIIEYQYTDVSPLGHACYMAVSELCGNAIEHGRNGLGAYVAVQRFSEPRPQISVAISDLGIGIPEHIRQRYPEWADDSFAIAHAMDPQISGTGHPHRGNGFPETFEAALVSSLSAARLDVHSANGFVRTQIVQETKKIDMFPAAAFKRGTWIAYDLISAAG